MAADPERSEQAKWKAMGVGSAGAQERRRFDHLPRRSWSYCGSIGWLYMVYAVSTNIGFLAAASANLRTAFKRDDVISRDHVSAKKTAAGYRIEMHALAECSTAPCSEGGREPICQRRRAHAP